MKAIVVEVKSKRAIVVDEGGRFMSTRNHNFEAGQEVEISKQRNSLMQYAVSLGAIVLLASGIGTAGFFVPFGNVTIDVNPSIEIESNAYGQVIDVNALNSDAEAIVNNLDLDGLQVDEAVNQCLDKVSEEGYITNSDDVVIGVSGVLNTENTIAEKVEKATGIKATRTTRKLLKEATSLGITPAKLNILKQLQDLSTDVNLDDIKELPIKDILDQIEAYKADKLSELKTAADNLGITVEKYLLLQKLEQLGTTVDYEVMKDTPVKELVKDIKSANKEIREADKDEIKEKSKELDVSPSKYVLLKELEAQGVTVDYTKAADLSKKEIKDQLDEMKKQKTDALKAEAEAAGISYNLYTILKELEAAGIEIDYNAIKALPADEINSILNEANANKEDILNEAGKKDIPPGKYILIRHLEKIGYKFNYQDLQGKTTEEITKMINQIRTQLREEARAKAEELKISTEKYRLAKKLEQLGVTVDYNNLENVKISDLQQQIKDILKENDKKAKEIKKNQKPQNTPKVSQSPENTLEATPDITATPKPQKTHASGNGNKK